MLSAHVQPRKEFSALELWFQSFLTCIIFQLSPDHPSFQHFNCGCCRFNHIKPCWSTGANISADRVFVSSRSVSEHKRGQQALGKDRNSQVSSLHHGGDCIPTNSRLNCSDSYCVVLKRPVVLQWNVVDDILRGLYCGRWPLYVAHKEYILWSPTISISSWNVYTDNISFLLRARVNPCPSAPCLMRRIFKGVLSSLFYLFNGIFIQWS